MRVIRIYHPSDLAKQQTVQLSEMAAHHVAKVLRQQVGDKIVLFCNTDVEYSATIESIKKNNVTVAIEQTKQVNLQSPLQLHLAQAVSRGEKMDLVIQKATELGVAEITPILSERCGVKLSAERWQKRQQHWQAVVISACEQSGRTRLPLLNPVTTFESFIEQDNPSQKVICAPTAKQGLPQQVANNDMTVMIGPEGGFSEYELENAQNNGFEAIQLGPRILRTETAAIAALAIFQANYGDLTDF